MSCPNALKAFVVNLNEPKVDGDGITTMDKLVGEKRTSISKIISHGFVQFMFWIQDCKSKYMDYASGNPTHVQGYVLVTNYYILDQ